MTLAELRARGAATGDAVVAERLARRRPRRRRDDHLHVRDHRAAEGLRGHPRQPARDRGDVRPRARAERRHDGDLPVPAARPLARARRAVRGARGRRDAGVLGRRPEADRAGARRDPPDALPVRPAHLREGARDRAQRRGGEPLEAGDVRVGAAGGRAGTRDRSRGCLARSRGGHAPPCRRQARALQGARRVRRPAGDGAVRRRADRAARCSSSSTPAACWCSRATA